MIEDDRDKADNQSTVALHRDRHYPVGQRLNLQVNRSFFSSPAPDTTSSNRLVLDGLPTISITEGDFVVACHRSPSLSSHDTSPQLTTSKTAEEIVVKRGEAQSISNDSVGCYSANCTTQSRRD